MATYGMDAPVAADLSVHVVDINRFEIGANYRIYDAIGGMVNYRITPNLHIGYAYEQVMTDLTIKAKASCEFILLYDKYFSISVSRSPRYF